MFNSKRTVLFQFRSCEVGSHDFQNVASIYTNHEYKDVHFVYELRVGSSRSVVRKHHEMFFNKRVTRHIVFVYNKFNNTPISALY